VLSLAAVAYNILRLVGQQSLLKKEAPLRHRAKRRRLKTVMQEMMVVAAQLTAHARQVALRLKAQHRLSVADIDPAATHARGNGCKSGARTDVATRAGLGWMTAFRCLNRVDQTRFAQ